MEEEDSSLSFNQHQHQQDASTSSSAVIDHQPEYKGAEIIIKEAEISELIEKCVESEEEAYDLYNDYAFRIGFSVRKDKLRKSAKDKNITMRSFCCSKEGRKKSKGKCYRKLNTRTECKAKIIFHVSSDGKYIVVTHDMEHNHLLCPENKRHLLRSQRNVRKQDIQYLLQLLQSGIKLSAAIKALKREKGGTPLLGFINKDAYNEIAKEKKKKLEGSDCMALLKVLMARKETEADFFYDVDVDDEGSLTKFFWRDRIMKEDYMRFGDLLVHDTTYRTNRYDMICGPFIGINHHTQNIMFGCGFLIDEQTESFEWLFSTFLKSMDARQPVTIMTDQSAAMAAAIKTTFSASNHRICLWHLQENSKKNIRHLRALDGFVDMFKHVLMYCETQAEFEFYWTSLTTKYECQNNSWLSRLYNCKSKWCVPFTKDFFSAAVLSSQRSETTNNSVSEKLSATSGLYDFYTCYEMVVHDWRTKENNEDHRCQQGNPEMIANFVPLLQHARSIYTIEMFQLFQEQFLKSWQYNHLLITCDETLLMYHIGRPDKDLIKHSVTMTLATGDIDCTCKLFTELGIICSHIIRVMMVNCIHTIPPKYILTRWTRNAIRAAPAQDQERTAVSGSSSSVWRTQMCRKFNELVTTSQLNEETRQYLEDGFKRLNDGIQDEIRKLEQIKATGEAETEGQVNNDKQQPAETQSSGTTITAIKDPKKKRNPGVRNVRLKPKREKIFNMVAGKRVKAFRAKNHTKKTVQEMVQEEVRAMVGQGYLAHPTDGGPFLAQYPSYGHCPAPLQNMPIQQQTYHQQTFNTSIPIYPPFGSQQQQFAFSGEQIDFSM